MDQAVSAPTPNSTAGQAPPAHLVSGSDPSLLGSAITSLVSSLLNEDTERVDLADDVEPEDLALALAQPSMFAPAQLFVFRPSSVEKEIHQVLLGFLQDPDPAITLVLALGTKPTKELSEAFKAAGASVVEVSPPASAQARAEKITQMIDASSVTLDARARMGLIAHLGEDIRSLPSILTLLASVYEPGRRISTEELTPLLPPPGAIPPWDLTDAIERGRTSVALLALGRLLDSGRAPLQLLAILTVSLDRLFRVKASGLDNEREAAKALGIKGSTYPVRKAIELARRLTPEQTQAALAAVAAAGVDLKGGSGLPDRLVLEILVARLSSILSPASARAR